MIISINETKTAHSERFHYGTLPKLGRIVVGAAEEQYTVGGVVANIPPSYHIAGYLSHDGYTLFHTLTCYQLSVSDRVLVFGP